MNKQQDKITFSIHIDSRIAKELTQRAKEKGISRNVLINLILKQFVEKQEKIAL